MNEVLFHEKGLRHRRWNISIWCCFFFVRTHLWKLNKNFLIIDCLKARDQTLSFKKWVRWFFIFLFYSIAYFKADSWVKLVKAVLTKSNFPEKKMFVFLLLQTIWKCKKLYFLDQIQTKIAHFFKSTIFIFKNVLSDSQKVLNFH